MKLISCSECRRHVHAGEATCPFCDAPLPAVADDPTAHARGVSRAKRYALNAALATGLAAAVACGGTTTTGQDASAEGGDVGDGGGADGARDGAATDGASGDVATDSGPADTGAPDTVVCCPPYGCVFPDACGAARV